MTKSHFNQDKGGVAGGRRITKREEEKYRERGQVVGGVRKNRLR